ncbi:MAG: hypothetical protein ISR65_11440 [Bacteriovoracaceae bacterium]|nr:hypothetical protein [Bacteriovoracaceae bacterium]
MQTQKWTILLVSLTCYFVAPNSYAKILRDKNIYTPIAKTMPEKATKIQLSGNYFQTTGHYDLNGDQVDMQMEEAYSKVDGAFNLFYGINTNLEINVGIGYRSITSTSSSGAITSNSGFESLWGQFKYSFDAVGDLYYAALFKYRKTLYENNFGSSGGSSSDLELGDSGSEILAGAILSYQLSYNDYLTAMVGYKMPPNSLSHEIVYKAENAYTLASFTFLAGVDGIYTLSSDEYSDDPNNKPQMLTGSTYLFNSINRGLASAYAGIMFSNKRFKIKVAGNYAFYGVSTDQGFGVDLSISWQSGGTSKTKQKIEAFKEYNIEATVIKVSPRGKFVKIDAGISNDVHKGMKIDIYKNNFLGGNLLIASGIVHDVGGSWSIVKIVKKYRDIPIKKDLTARGY